MRADFGQNEENRSKVRTSNIGVDTEKPAGSWVLLTQYPRPSRFSGPAAVR